MKIKYFDHAATTRVSDEVLDEMYPYFSNYFFNASSIYKGAKNVKEEIEHAREKIANAIGAQRDEIYFTSGGTESDNLGIKGIAFANMKYGRHIITSKIEHPAVLNTCRTLERFGFRVSYVDVDSNGMIRLDDLRRMIRKDTILISVMAANNEIGTIQPLEEIGKIAKRNNIIFHTDAVQGIGNIKIDVKTMNIDSLSMSAHKFYGPKGVGALYVKKTVGFVRQNDGGHQENDKRSGTLNSAGIIGLGKAIESASINLESNAQKLIGLREYFLKKLSQNFNNYRINGDRDLRLPGNVNISFKGYNGNYLVEKLSERGIYVSSMSACSSGFFNPSHVLLAIGLGEEEAKSALRITFGIDNSIDEIDELIDSLKEIVR